MKPPVFCLLCGSITRLQRILNSSNRCINPWSKKWPNFGFIPWQETGLPLPSYDLWEEKIGVSTYTCSAVYAGFDCSCTVCELLDKRDRMRKYKQVAQEIKDAAIKYLFNEELDSFARIAYNDSNGGGPRENCWRQLTLWSLVFWYVRTIASALSKTLAQVRTETPQPRRHWWFTFRYEARWIFHDTDISNPWIITTLWEALKVKYKPERPNMTEYVEEVIQWVVKPSVTRILGVGRTN